MKKILHIISSPRGEASFSIKLGNAIVDKLKEKYPDNTVKESNLVAMQFPHLEEAHLTSFFTPPESRTEANLEAVKHSDQAIKELMDADVIVLGAPMYNFTIHSSLKAWLDHIVRAGITFRYDANGAEGLVKNKEVYIAETSGAIYSEGPMQSYDFVAPYLKTILGHIGITDVTVFRIEGTGIPVVQDTAVEKGINSIQLN
jgi:FMN-dependent NADH-azoreductase